MESFVETLYPAWGQQFKVGKLVYRRKSKHQELAIFENDLFGRVLALDGAVQLTAADEFIYHEMLAHLPMLAHGQARKVAVIGGGDGGTLRELLKHKAVERATLVEIDGAVIEMSKKYLPALSAGAFDDPRTETVLADGAAWLADSRVKHDVILIDSTDPVGPGESLFTAEFYAACKKRLAPGGVLAAQCGAPFLQRDELKRARDRLAKSFAEVAFYLIALPTYVGGYMALAFATDDAAKRFVARELLEQRLAGVAGPLRCYTPDLHRAAFALPLWVQKILG